MKLKEFFDQQGKNLSEEAKFAIYQQILEKKQKSSTGFLHRISAFTKTTVYSLIIATITLGLFGFITNNDYSSSLFGNKGFNISTNTNTTYRASADGIGMIQQFYGSYQIIDSEGNKLETNIIQHGDTITLAEGSYMQADFKGNAAKIIGPAILKLHKSTNGNNLVEIIEGKFIELENQNTETQLEVKKKNLTIAKTNKSQSMKIQITEDNGETVVKNIGNEGDTINIQDQSQGDSTEINAQEQITLDKESINTEKVIAITEGESTPEEKELETLLALLEKQEETNTLEQTKPTDQIDQDLTITQDTKKIPTENQLQQVENLLSAKFVNYDLNNIILAIQDNNPNKYSVALANFSARIQNIGDILEIELSKKDSLADIKQDIETLMTQIPENYYIPASTTNNLLVSLGRVEIFENTENITTVELDPTKDYTAEELVRLMAETQPKPRLLIPRD